MTTTTTSETGTCQICGRSIKLNKSGFIVRHGYRRIQWWGDTGACEGTNEVPFEVSGDKLKEVIEQTERYIVNQEARTEEFKANPPAVITFKGNFRGAKSATYIRPDGFVPVEDCYIPRTYAYAYCATIQQDKQSVKLAQKDVVVMTQRLEDKWPTVVEPVVEVEVPAATAAACAARREAARIKRQQERETRTRLGLCSFGKKPVVW